MATLTISSWNQVVQFLREVELVPTLRPYDECFGLARKCTWALADIGTPEAHARLEILAKHSNPQIAAYAQKRLDEWDDERPRNGA
jgi:hypothetical protein